MHHNQPGNYGNQINRFPQYPNIQQPPPRLFQPMEPPTFSNQFSIPPGQCISERMSEPFSYRSLAPPSRPLSTQSHKEHDSAPYRFPPSMPIPQFQQNFQQFSRPPPFSSSTISPQSLHPPPPSLPYNQSSGFSDAEFHVTSPQFNEKSIENWLKLRTNRKQFATTSSIQSTSKAVPIPAFRDNLHQLSGLVDEFNNCLSSLKDEVGSLTQEQWKQKREDLMQLKEYIVSAESSCLTEEIISDIARKLKLIRNKRTNQNRRRNARKIAKAEVAERFRRLDLETDTWLEQRRAVEAERKSAAAKAERARKVLADVRRRRKEVEQSTSSVEGLRQLRELRKSQAEHRGRLFPSAVDDEFQRETTSLLDLLQAQTERLLEEEALLQAKLDAENETASADNSTKRWAKVTANFEEVLFGPTSTGSVGISERSLPFYHQGNEDINSFVKIRQEWDAYICPEDDERDSRIPVAYVLPEPPCNEEWAKFLHTDSSVKME